MTYSEPARTTTPRIARMLVAGLLVVIAAIAAALGSPLLASSAAAAAPPIDVPGGEHPRQQLPPRQSVGEAAPPIDVPGGEHRGAPGEADGAIPHGTTVFDDEIPGVANLDPALLGALRQAATDA